MNGSIVAKTGKKLLFLSKAPAFLERQAFWLTLFVAILLLLAFYHQSILPQVTQQAPYLPIDRYTSLERIPLWNPAIYSGMPVWGNPPDISRINIIDSALFSLLQVTRPFVPDIHFFYLLLNLLLCSGFMYGFMRQLGIRPAAAAYTALLVLFIPQIVIHVVDIQWLNILPFCLTPAVLYYTLLLLEQRRLLWFALGAFFLTFQLLRASAEVTIMTLALILVLYIVYSLHWRVKTKVRTFMSRGALCLAMIGLSSLLAAYVYLPFLEFIRYIILPENARPFSFDDIFLCAYPSFNGQLVDMETRFIPYFGVIVLFLAGFAILLRRNWRTFLLLSASIGCVVISLSGHWRPAIYATPFIFLILAGIGLNALVKYRHKEHARKKARWLDVYMLIVWGVFSVGFMIFLINKPGYMHHILEQMPLLTLTDQNMHYRTMLLEGAIAFVLISLAFLLIRLYIDEKIHVGLFFVSLLALSLGDYMIADYRLMAVRKEQAPELPAIVSAELKNDKDVYRIFSTTEHSLAEYFSILGETRSVLKTYYAFLDRTGLNETDVRGMRNPFFAKYTRLVARGDDIVEEPIPVDYIDPVRLQFDRMMLDLLNVKYIVCQSPIHDANYFCIYDSSFFVYRNSSFLPRAFFVDSVFVLPGRRAIFDAMQTANYDPRQLAFIEQYPPFSVGKSDSSRLEITSFRAGRMTMDVDVKHPSMLVLSEVYHPVGWRLFIDDQKADLYKTNYFLISMFLQPGQHRIRLEFQPTLFRLGVSISIVSLVFWLGAFVTGVIFYLRKNKPGTR
ncbi:YfhO family protein [candidate division KSB1 bacterium]|nr:YfhO family protein [candidate division KSB1 bacterium]